MNTIFLLMSMLELSTLVSISPTKIIINNNIKNSELGYLFTLLITVQYSTVRVNEIRIEYCSSINRRVPYHYCTGRVLYKYLYQLVMARVPAEREREPRALQPAIHRWPTHQPGWNHQCSWGGWLVEFVLQFAYTCTSNIIDSLADTW